MIIVVEGIDRVGKTTLCSKLSKNLNIPVFKHKAEKFDYSKMDNENETDKILLALDLCDLLKKDIIFDRLHWSDYVYGNLERNYDSYKSASNIEIIENKLKNMETIIVYIKPTDLEESSRQHGKDLFKYDKLMDLCYNMCKLKKIKCNYSSIDKIVEEIKNGRV